MWNSFRKRTCFVLLLLLLYAPQLENATDNTITLCTLDNAYNDNSRKTHIFVVIISS